MLAAPWPRANELGWAAAPPCEDTVKETSTKQTAAFTGHRICWCLDPDPPSLRNYEK